MLKGLSEQVANVRYNTLTSALDAVLLVLLLPRWGLGGYIFAFAATHLLNLTLSLRRPVCLFWLRVSAERRSAVCRRVCGGCCICRNAAKKRRRFVDFFTEKSYNQSRI